MKKNLVKAMLAIAVLLVGSTSVSAKSWRVNPNPNMKANFTDINAAMASEEVVAGDTLYLDPGATITTEQTISKEVVVVGTGYFFTDQPHSEAKISSHLNITAANAKVEGLYITGETRIKANYVTLERCRMGGYIKGHTINQGNSTSMNTTLRQCYIDNYICGWGSSDNKSANWLIENCFITFGETRGTVRDLYSATVRNCFIRNTHGSVITSGGYNNYLFTDCNNLTLTNNILMAAAINKIFSGCNSYTCSGNVFSCPESNLPGLAENNVFLNHFEQHRVFSWGKPNDLWLELCEDSPAKGVGVGGVDAGPCGGLTPYVFSGYPQGRPYFKAATVSPVAKDGKVSVKLNLKMQDE